MYAYCICLYHYIPLHLMSKPPLHVYGLQYDMFWTDHLWMHVVWHAANLTPMNVCVLSHCLMYGLYSVVKWISIMHLVIYDTHIIHYHMNSLWSVALGESYFAHPDCLVIYWWIWATLLFPTYSTPGGAKCLEVCSIVWRSGGLYADQWPLPLHCHHFS